MFWLCGTNDHSSRASSTLVPQQFHWDSENGQNDLISQKWEIAKFRANRNRRNIPVCDGKSFFDACLWNKNNFARFQSSHPTFEDTLPLWKSDTRVPPKIPSETERSCHVHKREQGSRRISFQNLLEIGERNNPHQHLLHSSQLKLKIHLAITRDRFANLWHH